jgi:hypothetical protein
MPLSTWHNTAKINSSKRAEDLVRVIARGVPGMTCLERKPKVNWFGKLVDTPMLGLKCTWGMGDRRSMSD